jgi:hypothetical protein
VTHTLNLTGVRCEGGVVLREAHIGGQLECSEAEFRKPDGIALNAAGLVVTHMFLTKASCIGEVRLIGSHIAGQLNCSEAEFRKPDGIALNANGLVADTHMFLTKASCIGEVRVVVIGGDEGLGLHWPDGDAVLFVAERPAAADAVAELRGLDVCEANLNAGTYRTRPTSPTVPVYRCPYGAHVWRRAVELEDMVSRLVLARLQCPDVAELLAAAEDDDEAARRRLRPWNFANSWTTSRMPSPAAASLCGRRRSRRLA